MMKKLLCFLLLLPISFVCMAQEVEIRVHEVQRGESLEHVAARYGISVEDLLAANVFANHFYVGQKLNIPILDSQEKTEAYILLDKIRKYLLEGTEEENRGKCSSARKIYEEGLSTQGEIAYLHYCIGRCHYKNNSWKKAIKELRLALQIDDSSLYMAKDTVENLLADAQEKREMQLEERRAIWSELGAGLAATVAIAANAYVQSKTLKEGGGAGTSKTGSSSSVSVSEDTNNDGGGGGSSQSGKRCRQCLGSGKCKTCNGKGHYFDNSYGIAREYECPNCSDGSCSSCGGTGYR